MSAKTTRQEQGTAVTKKCQTHATDTNDLALLEQVNIAMDEIAADMREGELALAVGARLRVMAQLMEVDPELTTETRTRRNWPQTVSGWDGRVGPLAERGPRMSERFDVEQRWPELFAELDPAERRRTVRSSEPGQ